MGIAESIEDLLAKMPPGFVTLSIGAGRCQANFRRSGSPGWSCLTADTPTEALHGLLDREVHGHRVFRQDDIDDLI